MNIELLDEKRVLIDLCLEDMQLLSIEYNRLDTKSSYNRKIINSLISIAKIKTGFHNSGRSSVYVEAMPYDGGCFILITLNEKNKKKRKYKVMKKLFRSMFVFDSCEDMLCAIEKLHNIENLSYKSSLIYYKNNYFLLLSSQKPIKTDVVFTVNEYSNRRFSNKIQMSHILEHGKIIAFDNAVEKIGVALCK